MTIETRPIFYFVEAITSDNQYLNFVEPNVSPDELTAIIPVGGGSMSELAIKVQTALNVAGTQDYTVVLDRDTRKYTIISDDTISLLVLTGANTGLSIFSTIGFTGADLTGQSSFEGDAAGTSYQPQFPLQSFLAFEDNVEGINPSINESANGTVEVVTYGSRRFMEFNIKFITDRSVGSKGPWQPLSTVQDARDFLEFCITKGNLEFMIDRDNRGTFDVMLLEKTSSSKVGVGFKLMEMLKSKLVGYYETKILTFRKVS